MSAEDRSSRLQARRGIARTTSKHDVEPSVDPKKNTTQRQGKQQRYMNQTPAFTV